MQLQFLTFQSVVDPVFERNTVFRILKAPENSDGSEKIGMSRRHVVGLTNRSIHWFKRNTRWIFAALIRSKASGRMKCTVGWTIVPSVYSFGTMAPNYRWYLPACRSPNKSAGLTKLFATNQLLCRKTGSIFRLWPEFSWTDIGSAKPDHQIKTVSTRKI